MWRLGSKEDEVVWNIDNSNDEDDKTSLMIVRKVWARKNVNANTLMEMMKIIW